MTPALSVHERWHEIAVTGAPQILSCNFCVLLKWEHDDLSAPYWRWYWNDRAGADLILEHERVAIEAGRVVLIPPHTVFGTALENPVGHLYVHFSLGLDRAVTPGEVFKYRPSPAERNLIRRLVRTAEEPASARPLESSFWVQSVVNASLASIPGDYWEGRLTDARIMQALQMLGSESGAGDNVALARAAGMNPTAFIRKFLQATGHTPHQYRLRLRVERACAWLREGRMSVEEIAAAAGFCDRFHFSRAFKKHLGMGPAKYRMQCAARRA